MIVAATPRSGTHYIWKVLEGCGLKANHEVMNPNSPRFRVGTIDVSCYATPLLCRAKQDSVICHQTRDPRKVIASLSSIKHNSYWKQWLSIGVQNCWVVYNQLIEGIQQARQDITYVRYQVEKLTPEGLQKILNLAGYDPTLHTIERSMASVPKTCFSLPRSRDLRWDELEPAVQDMARRYGYAPE